MLKSLDFAISCDVSAEKISFSYFLYVQYVTKFQERRNSNFCKLLRLLDLWYY